MSYVGKIMSDVIQTTSDLFCAVANAWSAMSYANNFGSIQPFVFQRVVRFVPVWAIGVPRSVCAKANL